VTRDNDQIYKKGFDRVMENAGILPKRLAFRSLNTNAFVERFIQTIQVECLDHFLVFGKKHFDYLVREYVEHYHTKRPHQVLGNELIDGQTRSSAGEIRSRTRLGGLIRHYYRNAA
jgi:putative transposase